MKKLLLLLFISSFQIFPTFACIPFSPQELIIATYNWKEERIHPDENFREWRKIQFIKLGNVKKPFAESYNKKGKYYFLHSDNDNINFDLKNYQIWDQIIAISDYNNWNFDEYFAVYEIGKLVYKNWNYEIQNSQWNMKKWWKNLWQCWNYKPENVMDEKQLLQEIASYIDIWVSKQDIKNSDKFLYIIIFWFIFLSLSLVFILKKISFQK